MLLVWNLVTNYWLNSKGVPDECRYSAGVMILIVERTLYILILPTH